MRNRYKHNWLSTTTSHHSQKQITVSLSLQWSATVCLHVCVPVYMCIMAIHHTRTYTGECGLSFVAHTQDKVTLTYLNTHRHDAQRQWAAMSGLRERETRTEPSSTSFTFNWERFTAAAAVGLISTEEINKGRHTNWSTNIPRKCNLSKC